MKIIANEQAFQSIYINLKADAVEDRIVFHTPIFKNGMTAALILKTLRLENALGVVLCGPKANITAYQKQVKEMDAEESWGNLEGAAILEALVELGAENGLSIFYLQAPADIKKKLGEIQSVKPAEQTESEPVSEVDKEMALKLKEITLDTKPSPSSQNVVYPTDASFFDPSLSQMSYEQSSKLAFEQITVSPSLARFPEGIAEGARAIWQAIVERNKSALATEKTVMAKWVLAMRLFLRACEEMGVAPFIIKPVLGRDELQKELNTAYNTGLKALEDTFLVMKASDLVSEKKSKPEADRIIVTPAAYYLSFKQSFKLSGLASHYLVLENLAKQEKFFVSPALSAGTKKLSDRAMLTVKPGGANTLDVHITIYLSLAEIKNLWPTTPEAIRKANLQRVMLEATKTGKINLRQDATKA